MATPEIWCPKCGSASPSNAVYCGSCGSPLAIPPGAEQTPVQSYPAPASQPPQAPYPPPPYSSQARSNRGTIGLVFSIAGFFCGPIAAIPGIILGKMEMNAIQRGEVSAAGLGTAKAAFYVGIIAIAVSLGACMILGLLGVLGPMMRAGF